MKINIKLSDGAILPKYSKNGDAGMDLVAVSKDIVNEKDYGYISYNTGLSMEIPEGYVGLIFPRSSISNTGMIMSNSVAVIDSGFRGKISCRFKWIPDTKQYEVGERIAQLIIIPYPQIEFEEISELSETERGTGGYGSSGK